MTCDATGIPLECSSHVQPIHRSGESLWGGLFLSSPEAGACIIFYILCFIYIFLFCVRYECKMAVRESPLSSLIQKYQTHKSHCRFSLFSIHSTAALLLYAVYVPPFEATRDAGGYCNLHSSVECRLALERNLTAHEGLTSSFP